MTKRYPSMSDFRQDVEKAFLTHSFSSPDRATDWLGGVSPRQALDLATYGDDSTVAEAQKLLDKLSMPEIATRRAITVRSPYGGRVNVSDWLSGSPVPMRRRRKTDLDTNPLGVYVSTTSSCSIRADAILKRGIAILAFVLRVQEVRPVDLYLVTDLDGRDAEYSTHLVIPIESRPLNLSMAAYCLASAGYDRGCTHPVAKMLNGYCGGWGDGFEHTARYTEVLRRRLGASADDVIVPSIHASDPLAGNPLAWINTQLERVGIATED